MRLTAPRPLLVACLAGTRRLPALHCSTVPDALSEVRRRVRGRRASATAFGRGVKTKRGAAARAYDAGQREFGENPCRSSSRRRRRCPTTCSGASSASCSRTRRRCSSRACPTSWRWDGRPGEAGRPAAEGGGGGAGGARRRAALRAGQHEPVGGHEGRRDAGGRRSWRRTSPPRAALRFRGVMTIGAPGDERCFGALRDARDAAAAALSVPADSLELSMGMSGDFSGHRRRLRLGARRQLDLRRARVQCVEALNTMVKEDFVTPKRHDSPSSRRSQPPRARGASGWPPS